MRNGSGGSLRILFPQGELFVAAQTENRGDAVAQVDSQLSRIIHVAVRVDQSWNDGLSGRIDPLRAGRNFDAISNRLNPPVPDQQSRVLDGRLARAVDDACAYPSLQLMSGRAVLGSRETESGKNYCSKNRGTQGRHRDEVHVSSEILL